MRPQLRGLVAVVVILLVIAAAIAWTTRSNAPVPDYQNRVTMPGMEPHTVTLWLQPSEPIVGLTELTVQIGDPTGMPIGVSDVGFLVYPMQEFPDAEIQAAYVSDAPTQDFLGRGHGYRATADFDEAGDWIIEVRFVLGEVERTTQFEVIVDR